MNTMPSPSLIVVSNPKTKLGSPSGNKLFKEESLTAQYTFTTSRVFAYYFFQYDNKEIPLTHENSNTDAGGSHQAIF